MNRVLINIKDYRDSFKAYFDNKDLISIDELLSEVEDLIFDNESLQEKISDLENKEYIESDEYIPESY